MSRRTFILLLVIVFLVFSGCSKDALDPTQIGRFRPVPVVNVILDSLGVADEPDPVYSGAEEPIPADLVEYNKDYTFGVGDTVRISIYELRQEGIPYVNDYIITETGRISIPDVGLVRAEGLTEAEFEEEISRILSPNILLNPSVKVTLLNSRRRVFYISGNGVAQAGTYQLPRDNYRLLEAIAVAGGVAEFNLSNVYVHRRVTGDEEVYSELDRSDSFNSDILNRMEPVEPEAGNSNGNEDDILEVLAPYSKKANSQNQIIVSTAEMAGYKGLESIAAPEGFQREVSDDTSSETSSEVRSEQMETAKRSEPGQNQTGGRIEWVFRDGKWVPFPVGQEEESAVETAREGLREMVPEKLEEENMRQDRIGWEQIGQAGVQSRVIRIPVDKLLGGDKRYNIVVRPGDSITAPVDILGEFWVMGNVNAQGPISLQGRPLTLKMAIASAGGLGPLAWPKKVEVVRRIGKNKEEIVMVDLDKIAKGLQPDFFIKPYDLINVGTHGVSRWLAVLRNAFRATYGFGFIYDRNFATNDFDGDPFPGNLGSIGDYF